MLVIFLLSLPAIARAEPVELTYKDALQSALNRNPELQGIAAQLEQASGALMVAEGAYDLQLTAGSSYSSATSESIREFGEVLSEFAALNTSAGITWLGTSGTSATVDLSTIRSRFKYELAGDIPFTVESEDPLYQTRLAATVSQSLLEGHRRSYNLQALRQAQQAIDSSELGQAVQRQQTLADTADAYWSLWTARKLVTIAEEGMALAEEEMRLVHAKVELGELAPVERSRVDATVLQSESDLLEARHNEQSGEDALLLLIGMDLATDLALVTNPEQPMDHAIDLAAAQQSALEGSPALTLAVLEEEGARADVEAARHALLPQLGASASYALLGYETSQAKALGEMFGASLPEWSLGVNLSMPLGNRSAQGTLASASASLAEKTIDREALERRIRQQVSAQLRTLSSAQAKLGLTQRQLSLAQETLDAERALRDAGRSLEKDVLDSMKDVSDARVAVEQAKVDYILAIIELERLKGSL
jgi:outer membrane protein TolC